jgi:hypothetical protein
MVANLKPASGALPVAVALDTRSLVTSEPVMPKVPAQKVAIGGGSLVPTPRVSAVLGRVLGTLDDAAASGVAPRALPSASALSARGQALRLLQDGEQPVLLPVDEGQQRATTPEVPRSIADAFEHFAAQRPQAFVGLDAAQNAYARGAMVLLIGAVQAGELAVTDVPAALQLIAAVAAQHGQANVTSAPLTGALVTRPIAPARSPALPLDEQQARHKTIITSLARGQSRSSIAQALGIYGATFSRSAVPDALEWAAPGAEGELAALSRAIDNGSIAVGNRTTDDISHEQAQRIQHAAAQNLPALTMDHLLALQGAANGWDDVTIATSMQCTKSNARNLLKQATAALGIDSTAPDAKASAVEAARTLGLVAPLPPREALSPDLLRLLQDLAQTHSLGLTPGDPRSREMPEHRAQVQRAAKVLNAKSNGEYDVLTSAIEQGIIDVSSAEAADIESIAALGLPGLKVDAVRMLRQMASGRGMRALLSEFQRSRVRQYEGELRAALNVERASSRNKSELVDRAIEAGLLDPQSLGAALGSHERQVLLARARQEPLDAMAARLGVNLHWVAASAMPTIRRAFAAANGNEFLALQRAIDLGVIPSQPADADGLTAGRVQQIRRLAALDLPLRLEHEIELDGLARGLSVTQISRLVGLPQSAISADFDVLLSMAHVGTNKALVAWGQERGLIGISDVEHPGRVRERRNPPRTSEERNPPRKSKPPAKPLSEVEHVLIYETPDRFHAVGQPAIRQAAAQRLVEHLTAQLRQTLRLQAQQTPLSVVDLGSNPSWVAARVREQLGSKVGTVSVDSIDPHALPDSRRFGYIASEDPTGSQTANAIREQLRRQTGAGRASDVVLSFSLSGQPYELRRTLMLSSELLREGGKLHILQPSESFNAAGWQRFNEAVESLGLEFELQQALGSEREVLLLRLRKNRPAEQNPPFGLFDWRP